MRDRFNLFILALVLILVAACSKPKAPETPTADLQQESPVPGPETAPAEPMPGPTPTPAPGATEAAPTSLPVVTDPKTETATSFWERLKPTVEPPALVVPQEEPLRVYYQKDPIPETWCAAWTATGHGAVQQLKTPTGVPLPKDGDVYLFTPDMYPQILAGPGALTLGEGWARAGMDPVFTGHPFDEENLRTRPWRWTPYLLYAPVARTAPWKEKRLTELWVDPKALWPDEMPLLTGLTLKDEKMSANPRNDARWLGLYRALQNRLHDKVAPESECWQKLQAGEIELTLLPASCRLSLPAETTAAFDWAVPPGGTLIYFEQVAIAEGTKKKEAALSFVEYLLQVAQQKRLLAETGYFSVRTKPGSENQQAALNLGKKEWFDQSEFLMDIPALPAVEGAAPTGPAAAPEPGPGTVSTPTPVTPEAEPVKLDSSLVPEPAPAQ